MDQDGTANQEMDSPPTMKYEGSKKTYELSTLVPAS